MKILLVSVNKEIEPYPVYPLGMGVIARVLENEGHIVCQKDILVSGESDILQHIASNVYDIIGISLRNIDNVDSLTEDSHWSLGYLKDLIDKIKAVTVAPIFLGGAGFSVMPDDILRYTNAFCGVAGEGETAVLEMLSAMSDGNADGKIFSAVPERIEGAKIDETIACYYIGRSGVVNVQTKRGCTHKCAYCTYPLLEGHKIRARSINDVIDDIEKFQKYEGIDEFFFTDSVFNDSAGHWLELVEAIIVKGLKIKWSAFFEPTSITKDALKLCIHSGLKSVELGTDATTDETLKGLNKPFKMEDVFIFNELCATEKMPVANFVIFGGPNETDATLDEGIKNLQQMKHSIVFGFMGIRLYKNTPLYSRAIADGAISENDDLLRPTYYFSPRIDVKKSEQRLINAFKRDRTKLFPPSKGQEYMTVALDLGFRGTLWDKLIRYSI